ncbi:hypothetical protein Agub_g15243 [Astrephomene gubernaculifera]|uniref:Uncharacterized protein n=1 Tax=Astrephomene gubernaculifera TaxID=47775 RepID=A0AAD3E6P4_9CHLO|nr:hypothetical protein Agub_g15243 [Astrephomene gubernaculifera]
MRITGHPTNRLVATSRTLPAVPPSRQGCEAQRRVAGLCPFITHPCRHPQQPPAPSRHTKARIFDGLKTFFPASRSTNVEPAEEPQDVLEYDGEDIEGGSDMKLLDSEGDGLAEDQDVFGPLAVLLVGFLEEEVAAFRRLMDDMEADMVQIVPCSPGMMAGTLQAALEAEVPGSYEQPPLGTRRTVFLSGMVGAEVLEVISAYREAGMPPTVWAAAVPNNYQRVVRELVEEVHADNAAMVRRAQEAQARRALEEASEQDGSE